MPRQPYTTRRRHTDEEYDRADAAFDKVVELLGVDPEGGEVMLEPARWVCLTPAAMERLLGLIQQPPTTVIEGQPPATDEIGLLRARHATLINTKRQVHAALRDAPDVETRRRAADDLTALAREVNAVEERLQELSRPAGV